MGELKRRRQALTAAVYGEARVESFDGKVLRLLYPEEQSFHVGMARDPGHLEKLAQCSRNALAQSRASRSGPREENRAPPSPKKPPPATEEPPPPVMEPPAPEPAPDLEEHPPEMDRPNGVSGPEAQNRGPAPRSTADDGVIQNELEVFEIARELEN